MRENKSLLKNTIYNALYNGLNIIFPLITIPYLSRVLLADGLGIVNYSRNIVSWFLVFASLGIPRYGIREVARNRTNKDSLNKVFTELFVYNFISTSICIAVYITLLVNIPYFSDQFLLYFVTGIQLFLNIFNVDYLYQGLEEYGYITKRSFAVKLISLICMLLFVKTKNDYIIYALIQSLAVAGNFIFNFINLHKYIHFSFKQVELSKHTKPIFILLSTQLAVSLYALLDTTMLGILTNDSVVGYYTNVYKIIVTISTITASLGGVMLPRLVTFWSEHKLDDLKILAEKAQELIIAICLPAVIGMFILSPQIVSTLFGDDFMPCIMTIRIFSPFILITTLGNLYGTQLLMTFNKEKTLLITVSVGSIVNMTLNAILIPYFQQNGAALASVITECIVLVCQVYYVRKVVKIRYSLKSIINIGFIVMIMAIFLLIIQLVIHNDLIVIISSLFGSIALYLFLGSALNNKAIVYLIDIVKQRLL